MSTRENKPIVLTNEIAYKKPVVESALSRDEIDKELAKGVESLRAGKSYSADEVDVMLAGEFGI